MSRAQIVVTDLFIAVSVVIVLLTTIILFLNMYSLQLSENIEQETMEMKAFQIAETLVKNPGEPSNWESLEEEDVKIAGLAYTDRNLSKGKVDAFILLSENDIKKMFKIQLHDFFFRLRYINGTYISSHGTQFAGDVNINVRRLVAYENDFAIMEFSLWK